MNTASFETRAEALPVEENGGSLGTCETGQIINTTDGVKDGVAAITETTPEGTDEIRATLEKLTEGRFLSVEAMNEALKGLKGVKVEIPADEITRLNGLFPKELSAETLAEMENLKSKTEGKKGPLVMQLPAVVMVDGKERPFTITTMQEIMRKAANADSNLKPLWLSGYVPNDVKNQVWDSSLGVWTSACLEGSKSKNYPDQLKHQAEILGNKYGIEADMILAMVLRYISGQEELMRQDFMRLNTRDTDGDPLYVDVLDGALRLDFSDSCAASGGGLGASFRISS